MVEVLAPEREMAIRKEDWPAIEEKIADQVRPLAEAVRALQPSGWRKAFHILREWGVLAANVTVILTLGVLALTQWNSANSRLAAEASFRTRTEDRLTDIERMLLENRARAIVSSPVDSSTVSEAKSVLAEARQGSIRLPSSVVEQGGQKFVKAAETDAAAWGVALDFASYRTLLNFAEKPTGKFRPVPYRAMAWDLPWIGDNKPKVGISAELGLPEKEAAHMEVIGHDHNKALPTGPALIVVNGGAISLDSLYLRQVIFEGSEIHYSGGKPVVLDNVVFFDCRFVLENDGPGREFAQQVLGASRISWRTNAAALDVPAPLAAALPTSKRAH